ncbi:acetyl-CoA C-acyltransferase [Roseomonas hellenica]|uniref:Acetyl-CoA C-acyltransferase n=1 Tax=Plastoroseomonas hellenica TaxID=2687306 RepID=A0ABS5EX97_9PROT|nr:acetyl-CoA C-acyltransferase [Plastoroseomonas hellenica]MBR0664921.1 acetyl-CoA C-acyltransferase [Plastoroseomonas hellenica]
MSKDPIVIVGAARTPMGAFQGSLSKLTAAELGAHAIAAAIARSGLDPESVEETVFGCVLTAGQGQAPARQAAIKANIPVRSGATTVNKMCGSGMKAAMLANDLLVAGSVDVAVAGGMESMSNAPYLLDRARSGYRMGHGRTIDHMFIDGLEDAYEKGSLMGVFAEQCAEEFQFSREHQDEYAIRSLVRAQSAIAEGRFAAEIASITLPDDKSASQVISIDEQPGKARLEKIPTLRPAFRAGGTVTAANASSISDGAAALVLMRRSEADRRGLAPLAAIVGHATHGDAPDRFPTAPVQAIRDLLGKVDWQVDDVDLFEINEAFAVVPMAAMRELGLQAERVNVNGGACALGHPIGASGARIMVTLLSALREAKLSRGIASVCIGGGEATAVAIEICQ